MSLFTVECLDEADEDLANIWTQASDRNAVNEAYNKIEELLGRDPIGNGQEVAEGLLKICVPPILAFYSIQPARRRVEISQLVAVT